MRYRAISTIRALCIWIGLTGAALSLLTIAGAMLSEIESRLLPVVSGWSAVPTREIGGATLLRIRGDKRRACKYLGEDMALREPGVGETSDVASAWIDDPTPGSTRHPGRQDFGTMRVFTARSTPSGLEIIGVARHQCHPGIETITPIAGPGFVVPPLPPQ